MTDREPFNPNSLPLYLDYNATTPLDPRVYEAMMPWFLTPSNAGSRTHSYGQVAKEAVEKARKQVADVIAAKPEEIYFTSGATESNNLAILGLTAYGERTNRKHIISTVIEHKAVLEPLAEMRKRGFEVDLAPVTSGGFVKPDTIEKLLRPDTLLVSVMHANNETGVIQPIKEIAELVAETNTFFHTDAAQTFGKEVDALRAVGYDCVSISSHKIFGPQGVGALCVRRIAGKERPLEPIMFGGGQERGLRPGTIPVPLLVGFGEASRLAEAETGVRQATVLKIRENFLASLSSVEYIVNGDQTRCQPHVLNIRFPGVDSEAFMLALRSEISISNGSACTSARYSPSHVLQAMGASNEDIECSIRLSWGPGVRHIPAKEIKENVQRLLVAM